MQKSIKNPTIKRVYNLCCLNILSKNCGKNVRMLITSIFISINVKKNNVNYSTLINNFVTQIKCFRKIFFSFTFQEQIKNQNNVIFSFTKTVKFA